MNPFFGASALKTTKNTQSNRFPKALQMQSFSVKYYAFTEEQTRLRTLMYAFILPASHLIQNTPAVSYLGKR